MSYKLLVLDIDGTVTNAKKEVTEKTRQAIIHLQEKGFRLLLLPADLLKVCRRWQKHWSWIALEVILCLLLLPDFEL